MTLSLTAARSLWEPAGTYLNTASFGLPPRPAWDALQAALDDWRTGRTSWEHWGDATEAARRSFARLVGFDPAAVAVGATVSGLVGLVAASVPDGTRVLAPDVEFTSTLFPFLVQAHRGVEVRTVPAAELAESIDETTDLVAFSAVQMATGEVADLAAIVAAAREHGAATLVDVTQACGWLPLTGTGARHHRRRGLQVAALAAWDGVHGDRSPPTPRDRPDGRGVVRRRRRPQRLLRPAASARSRRPPARHLARLAQLGRRRTRTGPDRRDRRRGDPRARPQAREPLSRRSRPRAGRLGDSSSSMHQGLPRTSSGQESARRCAAAGCERRGISTTRTRTWSVRSPS